MAQKVPFSHRLDVVIDTFRSLFEIKFKKKRIHPSQPAQCKFKRRFSQSLCPELVLPNSARARKLPFDRI